MTLPAHMPRRLPKKRKQPAAETPDEVIRQTGDQGSLALSEDNRQPSDSSSTPDETTGGTMPEGSSAPGGDEMHSDDGSLALSEDMGGPEDSSAPGGDNCEHLVEGSLAPSEDMGAMIDTSGDSSAPGGDKNCEHDGSSAPAETWGGSLGSSAPGGDIHKHSTEDSSAPGGDGGEYSAPDGSSAPSGDDIGRAAGSSAPSGDKPEIMPRGSSAFEAETDTARLDRSSAAAETMETSSAAAETKGGSDVVIERGQRLRHISPREAVLRRHQEERAAQRQQPPEEPVNTNWGDVPQESADDELREHMTIGDLEPEAGETLPDTAGRAPPRTLTDICATYPIGNGLHYMSIERKKPDMFGGVPCSGWMGDVFHAMSSSEFRQTFGGGLYEVVICGPDPRGRQDPISGKPIIKSLTKPIPIRVPGHPTAETLGGIAEGGTSRSRGMFPSPFGHRGTTPVTTAEASMHSDAVRAMSDIAREERKRNDLLMGRQTGGVEPAVAAVRDTAREATQAVREASSETHKLLQTQLEAERKRGEELASRHERELAEMRRQLEQLKEKPTEAGEAWKALSQMTQAIAPGKNAGDELARVHEAHRHELTRIEETHRREIESLRAGFDDRVKILQAQLDTERQRAKDDVKEATDRFERKERETLASHEARIRETRERYETREKDAETRHRADLDRVKAEHERELRDVNGRNELVRTTEKQAAEGRIAQYKDRIELLKEEVDKAKDEASKKGDFIEQYVEFEKKAGVFGFAKADAAAPQSWQDRLADAFGKALQNADKITGNIASAVRDKRDTTAMQVAQAQHAAAMAGQRQVQGLPPGQPPAQQRTIRGPGGTPVRPTRTVWATGGDTTPPAPGVVGTPVTPGSVPPAQPVVIAQPAVEPVVAPQAAPAPPAAPVTALPVQPQPQPQPQPRPPQAAAQGGNGFAIDPSLMEQFRIWAEGEIENKSDPVAFGREFVERLGVAEAAPILLNLKIDALFEALAATAEMHGSPILRRDGQAFMRKAWAEGRRLCEEALGGQPS